MQSVIFLQIVLNQSTVKFYRLQVKFIAVSLLAVEGLQNVQINWNMKSDYTKKQNHIWIDTALAETDELLLILFVIMSVF